MSEVKSNSIEDLRGILFDTLRDLRKPDNAMDIDRAKAIAEVAREVISTARVEVDHMKIAGGKGSGFIPIENKTDVPGAPRLVKGRDTQG